MEKRDSSTKENFKRPRTPFAQRLCFSIGHLFCDLQSVAWFSYLLLYFTKVVGLSSKFVGIVWICEKILDSLASFWFSHISSNWSIPCLSRYCGKSKAWHLVGTVFLALFTVLLWTSPRLYDENLPQWLIAVYFICIFGFHDLAWETSSLTHMSMVTEIVKRPSEVVELHALRTTFTYIGGMYVYGVTWILLRQDNDTNLSSKHWKDFMYMGITVVITGLIVSFIFQVGTKTNANSESLNKKSPNRIQFSVEDYEKREEPLRTTPKIRNDCREEIKMKNSIENQAYESDYNEFISKSASSDVGGSNDWQSTASDSSGYCDDNSIEGWTDSGSESARDGASETYNEIVVFDPQFTSLKTRKEPCSEFVQSQVPPLDPAAESVEEKYEVENEKQRDKATKQWKDWLKDRRLYKIAVIFMSAKACQIVPFNYFPLFLTDALHFEKEAIAYFPLVVLGGSFCASLSTKTLTRILGNKWTYCLAASLVGFALLGFYFVSASSSRMLVYPCAIMLGSGSCVMLVTALSVATELIGSNSESGAFVFAFVQNAEKLTCGVVIGIIQEFYPEATPEGSCSACGNYVRHVFTIVPGLAAIFGFVAVMVFFPATMGCRRIVHTTDSETQTDDTSIRINEHVLVSSLSGPSTALRSPLKEISITTIPCEDLENPTSHRISDNVVVNISDDGQETSVCHRDLQRNLVEAPATELLDYSRNTKLTSTCITKL